MRHGPRQRGIASKLRRRDGAQSVIHPFEHKMRRSTVSRLARVEFIDGDGVEQRAHMGAGCDVAAPVIALLAPQTHCFARRLGGFDHGPGGSVSGRGYHVIARPRDKPTISRQGEGRLGSWLGRRWSL